MKSNFKPKFLFSNHYIQFPEEGEAIEKYFRLLDSAKGIQTALTIFKFIPLWIAKFLIKTGLIHKVVSTIGDLCQYL